MSGRKDEQRTRGLLGAPTTPLVLGAGAASLKRELPAPVSTINEASVGMNIMGDIIAAFGASIGVAPFITIADRAIMQNASGALNLVASMKAGALELLARPHVFVGRPEFRIITGVYFSTYAVANATTTLCAHRDTDPLMPRFFATSVVNVAASVSKDAIFTRMFGTSKPRPLPVSSVMLFAGRDSMTIAASFSFPGPVSRYLQDVVGVPRERADVAAQMALPPLIQLLSTPIYLLGLDLYNKPGADTRSRLAFIRREYWRTVFARWARIAPAYSIGGVANQSLIKSLRSVGL